MKGLTAKVFRTYNASTLFERELLGFSFKPSALQQEKVNAYNSANKKAAELCNHQRAAPKNHAAGMAKMTLHVSSYYRHPVESVLIPSLDSLPKAPSHGYAARTFPS